MKRTRLFPIVFCLAHAACDDSSGATNTGGAGGMDSSSSTTSPTGNGGASSSSSGTGPDMPGGYALPPPSECSNQFSVDGCKKGDPSSTCGGACANDDGPTSKNACEGGKEGVPVQYACPRYMLFADEMEQAAIDDGFEDTFNYAVAGHDPDGTNLDVGLPDSCCQCYQLVFDAPRYLTNSTLTPPKPLIVQSFNTQASGATGFDIYMGAGGLGAFNACDADLNYGTKFGYSQYQTYPAEGQAFNGGVKPGPDSLKCDNGGNLSDALIATDTCQQKVTSACNTITAADATLQDETRKSCIQSNQATSYYHENWKVLAKRVACPTHLMEVTGCKLAAQGLPAPDPNIQTAAQAKAAGFVSTLNNEPYHTTTMQDCCMPTCAWKNNVKSPTVDGHDSFYSCRSDGKPVVKQ